MKKVSITLPLSPATALFCSAYSGYWRRGRPDLDYGVIAIVTVIKRINTEDDVEAALMLMYR